MRYIPYAKYDFLLITPFTGIPPDPHSLPYGLFGYITIKQVNCFFVSEIFYINVIEITLFTRC